MLKLLPVYITSLLLAVISNQRSNYQLDDFFEKKYTKKDKFFFFVMAFIMAVFVGLRTRGNDTITYIFMYESMTEPGFEGLYSIDWFNISKAPGLQFIQVCLKTIGASTQDFLMICALFTVFTYLWFIRKYTNNIFLSVFIFLTIGGYTFTMAAIKQTLAVAFLLIGTDRAINKKYVCFLIWVFIAELFHPYAFIYLVVPFLFFNPWTKKTWYLIIGTIICSFGLQYFMGAILSITENLGYSYSDNSFTGEGVNIFRVMVVCVPVILSFMGRHYLKNNNDRVINIIINLTMMNALIMFIGLFGTANYFARLANYFVIFQTLSVPWLLRFFEYRSRKIVVLLALVGYFMFFYYGMVFSQATFDSQYGFISFIDYLKQLF